jgi:hypothetical protein
MKTGSHHLLRLKQPNTRVVCSIHSHSGNQSRNSIRSNQTTKHSDEWGGPAKYGWPQPMQSESPTKHILLSRCGARPVPPFNSRSPYVDLARHGIAVRASIAFLKNRLVSSLFHPMENEYVQIDQSTIRHTSQLHKWIALRPSRFRAQRASMA